VTRQPRATATMTGHATGKTALLPYIAGNSDQRENALGQ
jgi:hypothetical protein